MGDLVEMNDLDKYHTFKKFRDRNNQIENVYWQIADTCLLGEEYSRFIRSKFDEVEGLLYENQVELQELLTDIANALE